MSESISGSVTFVGAGPGDPELLTIKGRKALEEADVVVYAGSLVPRAIVDFARQSAAKYDSATMTLPQIHAIMRDKAREGKNIVRLHTGDPSLYGTLFEQTRLLDRDKIPWSVIPGVTAAMAAAARAGVSFSVPESTQSVILTRMGGRTPMVEDIGELARHGSSMAIYLAGARAEELQNALEKELPPHTPVICAHRVGWREERIFFTTLSDLGQCVAANGLTRQTVILVLPGHIRRSGTSRLYDANFSHGFRQ